MRLTSSVLAVALVALPTIAFAQTQPAPVEPAPAPAPAEPAAPPAAAEPEKPTAPVKGANSFTEAQAKERIIAAGYSDVGTLTLDADGIWNGPAKKDGGDVTVQLDFQGNVFSK